MAAGNRFVGGTLKGIESKLDYLQQLGVTGVWLNPPWKQRADLETYHGYGIQNFLDIEPRFGTRQDLRDLVDAAHDRGMYVILDVIFNHMGDNFFYDAGGEPHDSMRYRFSPHYELHGWRSKDGKSVKSITDLNDGVWPVEFQNPAWYTRAGQISNWGLASWENPMDPQVEFRRGDFYDMKDINNDDPEVMAALTDVYKYWIALSDCDGFRIDAVKHVSKTAARKFCSTIWQYAQLIGKENFLLCGEITDNAMLLDYLEVYGHLIDTALPVGLDIIGAPNQITGLAKGLADPEEFLGRYDTHHLVGRHLQAGIFHVSVLDDHDMCARAEKARFCAHDQLPTRHLQVSNAVALQLSTPGIPCMFYGTEQEFDGSEADHDYSVEPQRFAEDRYVREAMFGGEFGAFRTHACHFFNPDSPAYLRIAAMSNLRKSQTIVGRTLRGGHCYPRETSYCGYPFALPPKGEIAAWSQVLADYEVIIVMNTHGLESRGADVTLDAHLHPHDSAVTVMYDNSRSDDELRNPPAGEKLPVVHSACGRASVRVDLPPSGMVVLALDINDYY